MSQFEFLPRFDSVPDSRAQVSPLLWWAWRRRFVVFIAFGWAYVTDGMMTFDMREQDYRLKGCVPEYNKLPSKLDYDAAEAERKASGRRKDA